MMSVDRTTERPKHSPLYPLVNLIKLLKKRRLEQMEAGGKCQQNLQGTKRCITGLFPIFRGNMDLRTGRDLHFLADLWLLQQSTVIVVASENRAEWFISFYLDHLG